MIVAAASLIAALSLFAYRDQAARIAWRVSLPRLALRLDRADAELAGELGHYYFNGGAYDLKKAEEAYQKAVAANPGILWGHYQLARINFIEGHLDKALDEIDKELAVHPENLRSFYVRGLIYGYEGELDKAEEDFKKFKVWAPGEWAGYNDLTWIQAKLGKFQDAKNTILNAFERLPAEKARNPWLWTSLGVARLNLKEYNEAKDAFETALKITESMSAQYFFSAYPGNDPRGAEDAFRQFKATLYFNLGVAHERLDEWQAAAIDYNNYLAFLPGGIFPGREEVEQKIAGLNAHSKQ